MDGSNTSHNAAGVATAPFPPTTGEPPGPNPMPATLEETFADWLRIWDEGCETPSGKASAPMFAQLSEIIAEMRSLGFFEESSVAPNVLHHWNFEPWNVMAKRGADGQYKVTGLLDWDGALSVLLVLAGRPLAWLWLPEKRVASSPDWGWDVDELGFGLAELRAPLARKTEK